MKSFDLFVMSSVTEGLGSAILEAMVNRRPVVATRAGGIPEVVVDGETGLLVPPHDEPALADAMLRVLGDATARRPAWPRPATNEWSVSSASSGWSNGRSRSTGAAWPRATPRVDDTARPADTPSDPRAVPKPHPPSC